MIILLSLFGRKNDSSAQLQPTDNLAPKPEIKEEDFIDKTDPNQTSSEEKEDGLQNEGVLIDYSTNFPIDKIYAYIQHNWEKEGYNDALRDSDISNMNSKMKSIENGLRNSIDLVKITYEFNIKMREAEIQNLLQFGHVNDTIKIQVYVETYKEHLRNIEQIKNDLDKPNSPLKNMLENYHRGFGNGVAAKTIIQLENQK